ncbi:MAG: polymerase [Hyphomicrobiales bacterium]|nr:polymerase [Hyphomicrobiales bacterium]
MLSRDDISAEKMSGAGADELAAALRWLCDMGVDVAVGDAPRDYFAEAAAKAAQPPEAAPAPMAALPAEAAPDGPRPAARIAPRLSPDPLPVRAATPQGAVSPEDALAEARALAGAATSLDSLKDALAGFDGCSLKRSATNLAFAQGAPDARILFIGGAPDADGDRSGQVLAGRSGVLFDAMLAGVGLDRARVHLVNLVPWRPAGGKPPTPTEIAICEPFLRRYLELAAPDIVVALGDLPTRAVLGAKEPIVRARGKWLELALPDSKIVPAIAMLHPDYLLKAPAAKRYAWADMRALRKALAERGLA